MQHFNSFIQTIQLKPYRIFLADGLGACLSLASLLLIAQWTNVFYIPSAMLAPLSVMAAALSVLSLSLYFIRPAPWKGALALVIFLNLGYSVATTVFLIFQWEAINLATSAYFIAELMVVLGLLYVEIKLLLAPRI